MAVNQILYYGTFDSNFLAPSFFRFTHRIQLADIDDIVSYLEPNSVEPKKLKPQLAHTLSVHGLPLILQVLWPYGRMDGKSHRFIAVSV